MNIFLLILYGIFIPLFLTIIIELSVWKTINKLFNVYNLPYIIFSIIAVNIITNPFLNFFLSILDPLRNSFLLEFGFEIVIIFIEALILFFIYKKEFNKLLLLSAIMNLFSYGIGLIIYTPNWL
ncbi:MAG: hypothetical protein ACMXX8_03660 [Candidatus Woesearchaeota archaeon]